MDVLVVVSPAKSLDYESPLPTRKRSEPAMLDESEQLVRIMSGRSPHDLARLQDISLDLATLNAERWQDWERPFTPANARPAVLAFSGDVYAGMDARSFGERDFTHAQKSLRILSGLYGVLRPLDLIQPYRLEMGTPLPTERGCDLYAFWGDRITDALVADLASSPGSPVLVNLASKEYFGAVRPTRLGARVVTPSFLDSRGDSRPMSGGFFVKRARGAMAGWIIRNRVRSARALTAFDGDGYEYSPERSTADHPVFVRHHP